MPESLDAFELIREFQRDAARLAAVPPSALSPGPAGEGGALPPAPLHEAPGQIEAAQAAVQAARAANDVPPSIPRFLRRLRRPQHRVNRLLLDAVERGLGQIDRLFITENASWQEREALGRRISQLDRFGHNVGLQFRDILAELNQLRQSEAELHEKFAHGDGTARRLEERMIAVHEAASVTLAALQHETALGARFRHQSAEDQARLEDVAKLTRDKLDQTQADCVQASMAVTQDLTKRLKHAEETLTAAIRDLHAVRTWQESIENNPRLRAPSEPESLSGSATPTAIHLGDHRVLTRTANGFPMVVDARDMGISPSILLGGVWDPPLTELIRRRVRPGMRVLEVGAHIGYFTLLLCHLVGGEGEVFAFEPNPAALALLRDNLRMNSFGSRARVHALAAADRRGAATFHVYTRNLGSSSLGRMSAALDGDLLEQPTEIAVECAPLDEVLPTDGRLFDFVKLDAEGAEAAVLRGGWKFFRERLAPDATLAVEFNPPALEANGEVPADFFVALQALGRPIYYRTHDTLQPVEDFTTLDSWCISELVLNPGGND